MLRDSFLDFIKRQQLFEKQERVLLAVSGGLDSATLAHLFKEAGFSFGIAHCNFGLRGAESDEDEKFVKKLAGYYKVPFYSVRFDTATYAKQQHLSIQMAARELRYKWLSTIRANNDFNFIATAHHNNDQVETVLLNLIRGTGLAGLHGILAKRDQLIRPLLFAKRKEIEQYASENNLEYHEDSSNNSDKYARNKIRHHIIPVMEELNPSLTETFNKNAERVRELEILVNEKIAAVRTELIRPNASNFLINIDQINQLNPKNLLLFELLKPYDFSESTVSDIIRSIDKGESGAEFFSSSHRLIRDRKELIITPIQLMENDHLSIDRYMNTFNFNELLFTSKIQKRVDYILSTKASVATIDLDLLEFPLVLRTWKKGDKFYPLGMEKPKKISDFLIDNKVPIHVKEKTRVLVSGNKIAWIIGMRIDNRFRITENTKNIYTLEAYFH